VSFARHRHSLTVAPPAASPRAIHHPDSRTETSKSIDDTTKILAAQIAAAASKSTSDLDKLRREAAATAQTMGEEIKAM